MMAIVGLILVGLLLFYGGARLGMSALALAAFPVVALGAWLRGERGPQWGRSAWTDLRLAYLLVLALMPVLGWWLGR
jgi:hypothetical protein